MFYIKPIRDDAWLKIYELQVNNKLTSTPTLKLIESGNSGFFVEAGRTR